MKVQDIIANEGVVGSIAKALTPIAAKQGASAAAKATKTAQLKADVAVIGGVLGNWLNTIKNVTLAWGISVPIYTTAKEIIALNTKLKNNQITPEQYEGEVQYWLGRAATQIATIGAAKFAISTSGKLISTLPFGNTAGMLISKFSGPGAAAFGAYLTTTDGSEAFAQWFAGKTFLPFVADFMRDWVGSWTKQGYDALVGHEDVRYDKSATGNTAIDTISSIPTTSTSPKRDFYTGKELN